MFTLKAYAEFLGTIIRRLIPSSRSDQRLSNETALLLAEVEEWLSHDLFKDLGELRQLPLGSPVLQRRSGYREILDGWLRFGAAVALHWDGANDVFGAGKKDMGSLYQYWVFFALRDVLSGVADLDDGSVLVEDRPDGWGLRLRGGEPLTILGHTRSVPIMQMRYSYNRAFAFQGAEPGRRGTWTRPLRPDYTISWWPVGVTEQDAEATGTIRHLHFDAKYRVSAIGELFGNALEAADSEEELAGAVNYRYADLLKMHAYHDGIRRTVGAFVVYPGSEAAKFTKAAPGGIANLGAFPLRPSPDGSIFGATDLSYFLKEMLPVSLV